jgi:hypothetical protein
MDSRQSGNEETCNREDGDETSTSHSREKREYSMFVCKGTCPYLLRCYEVIKNIHFTFKKSSKKLHKLLILSLSV